MVGTTRGRKSRGAGEGNGAPRVTGYSLGTGQGNGSIAGKSGETGLPWERYVEVGSQARAHHL